MHFHYDFSANEILWTITFAGLLVLLVVLLGRDRIRRFPLVSAAITMMALRELASRLLFGRLSPMVASQTFLVMSDIASIISIFMVIEIARRAFVGAKRGAWITASLIMLALGGVVLAKWGPWPAYKTLFAGSMLGAMRFMQLFAQKTDVLADLLIVQLGVLVVLFGRRFKAGWRSHAQQIAIGLSTVSMSQLAVRIIWQQIATHTTIHSQAEYERVMGLQDKFYHGNNVIYLIAIVWWIACLWFDEPGATSAIAVAEGPSSADAEAAAVEDTSTSANAEDKEPDQPSAPPTVDN